MRLTFPHMGNVWVGVDAMANKLGIDLVVPPPSSQHTLSLGVRYSPETACLPFKLSLGNMIEALELGADTVVMLGGPGPCRFGYYNKVQKQILHKLGYNFKMVTQSLGIGGMIKYLTNDALLSKTIVAFHFARRKLKVLDDIEQLVHKMRATERDKGSASQIYRDAIAAIGNTVNHQTLNQAKREYRQKLMNLPVVSSSDVLRIGVIGEVFMVLDPFANMDIEIQLGKLGVEVQRPQSVWEWVRLNPFLIYLGLREQDKSHKAAMPYLSRHVGGDGWLSVGQTVQHATDWDGLVHLEPFGCLPETMARNIMPSIKEGLPVLNLIFDEHTAKARVLNRLEAFVDMLQRKKRSQVKVCV